MKEDSSFNTRFQANKNLYVYQKILEKFINFSRLIKYLLFLKNQKVLYPRYRIYGVTDLRYEK